MKNLRKGYMSLYGGYVEPHRDGDGDTNQAHTIDLLQMWHAKYEHWILEQAGIEQPQAEAAKPKAVTVA
ncbi:hypothetical protein [Castellaniella caeni]|uniref:hypothetical protein n=1 Tax=Castellaniella caeni TaxID=266123 RepID=UPI0011AFAED8|nr:hypothetical protein [Castellaniella caeni]